MQSKLLRHGNSSAVIIPSRFLKTLSIKRGDKVDLHLDYSRAFVILKFSGARQLRLVVDSRQKTGKIKR